ncbi:serum response factor-binding protein 1 isoform 2-T2 [Vipera latastei]
MAQVLNLNNEVVKMRKEVKKIRVLTIRKLTRHIAKLKGKKGTEESVLKNHRRAQRLLEEIHAMKPNSTARDRAIARLISHPLLKTKIANIKAAVEDFKNARQEPARAISSTEQQLEEQLNKHPGETQHSVSSKTLKQAESQAKTTAIEKPQIDRGEKQHNFESGKQKMADNMKKCPSYTSAVPDTENGKLIHQDQTGNTESSQEKVYLNHIVKTAVDGSDEEDADKNEGSGKEECFDDSTEERFYNESSGTDESNNNDDFFIGKVKRMKKKRTANTSQPTDPNSKDSNQGSKAGKLESEFYYSLSNTQKPEHVKRNIRAHLPRNKTTFEKNHPQKRMPKGSAVKYTIKRSPPQQPLHPSWEASRKMREQISQITAFQGKKIKFED